MGASAEQFIGSWDWGRGKVPCEGSAVLGCHIPCSAGIGGVARVWLGVKECLKEAEGVQQL